MKLDRLTSTTARPTQETHERMVSASEHTVERVEAMEGIDVDRQRSRQQELAAANPNAVGPFEGQEQVLASARQVAQTLTSLGHQRQALIALGALASRFTRVDEKA
jgi:hypothetical protein